MGEATRRKGPSRVSSKLLGTVGVLLSLCPGEPSRWLDPFPGGGGFRERACGWSETGTQVGLPIGQPVGSPNLGSKFGV